MHGHEEKPQEPVNETEATAGQEETSQQAQAATNQQQNQATPSNNSTATTDEIQPVNSSGETQAESTHTTGQQSDNGQSAQISPEQQTTEQHPEVIDDVDPDLIAQELTAVEIDPNDVDVADIIQIDNVSTYYNPDGSEMPIAMVHTQDGAQFMMVDVDNDMTFDVITDLEGNPIVQVDGNLTFSDVEDMMDETGGELAYNPERDDQELANGEDPEDGILDTLMGIFDDNETSDDLLAENKSTEDNGLEEGEEDEYGETDTASTDYTDEDSLMVDDLG